MQQAKAKAGNGGSRKGAQRWAGQAQSSVCPAQSAGLVTVTHLPGTFRELSECSLRQSACPLHPAPYSGPQSSAGE